MTDPITQNIQGMFVGNEPVTSATVGNPYTDPEDSNITWFPCTYNINTLIARGDVYSSSQYCIWVDPQSLISLANDKIGGYNGIELDSIDKFYIGSESNILKDKYELDASGEEIKISILASGSISSDETNAPTIYANAGGYVPIPLKNKYKFKIKVVLQADVPTMKVTYHNPSGTVLETTSSFALNTEQTLRKTSISDAKYKSGGWYTALNGTGSYIGAPGNSVKWFNVENNNSASDLNLYEHQVYNTYSLYYDANEGTVSTTSKTVTYSKEYGTLATPTRYGYYFIGWYTAKSGGTLVDASTVCNHTTSITIYAHWEPTGRVNVKGTWKPALRHVNVEGTWKVAKAWENVYGVWKEQIRG